MYHIALTARRSFIVKFYENYKMVAVRQLLFGNSFLVDWTSMFKFHSVIDYSTHVSETFKSLGHFAKYRMLK